MRFTDATMEKDFRVDHQAQRVVWVRLMTTAALLHVTVSGVQSVRRISMWSPEWADWIFYFRFFVVAPLWAILVISTFLPGHLRRAEWLHPIVMFGALVSLAVMNMGLGVASVGVGALLTVDFGMVMLASVIVLPMRFRWMAVAAVGACGLNMVFAYAILPFSIMGSGTLLLTFIMITVVSLALGWGRERTDRALYAQHVHVRQLAEKLEARGAELARLNAEKSEFMAVAAHDLRAPLGLVRGTLEMLRDGRLSGEARRETAMAQAESETGRMLTLVDDYLGAYAAESGALRVDRQRLDLGATAKAVAERHSPLAAKKQQAISVDAPVGRVWVWADTGLLGQVADNFVSNALKFSAPETTVRLELLEAEGAGVARLAVVDEGPGISAEAQPRLFQKFGRLGHCTTGGESSTGLGLAVAKRLAEAMSGRVGCESPVNADGTGAMFWVELPVAGANQNQGAANPTSSHEV